MAQSSQDILNQLNQQYGQPGDAANLIESTIKDAYAPSVKNLIQEGNTLRGQYYPAFFNEAQRLGTGAGDMSPAARLAAMQGAGENMGQLYRTNLGLRDYYNTDINNLVGRAQNQYQVGYGALKDQYTMALQGEQQRAAAAAQAAAQGAAAKAAKAQSDYFNNLGKSATSTPLDPNSIQSVMPWNEENLALMKAAGATNAGPILDAQGHVIGYKWKLPDGREIQLPMEGSDIPQYDNSALTGKASFTNNSFGGGLFPIGLNYTPQNDKVSQWI